MELFSLFLNLLLTDGNFTGLLLIVENNMVCAFFTLIYIQMIIITSLNWIDK